MPWANRSFRRQWEGPGLATGAIVPVSVAAATVGTGPDKREGLAVFLVEEVGVDRGVEARIVQLEAQIVAALVRALGAGGADLGAADQDPVAGGVVAGGAQVGGDAHAFGLDAEGDDVAGEFVRAGLLEGADGCHCKSPFSVSEPAPLRPRWRSTGRRRTQAHPRTAGGWTAQEKLSWLARNGGSAVRGRKL